MGGGVLVLLSLTVILPPKFLLMELTSHFSVFYAGCALIGLVLCLVFYRDGLVLALYLSVLLINVAVIVPYLPLSKRTGAQDSDFRLMQVNLLFTNQDDKNLRADVEHYKPDFIVLQEFDFHWDNRLDDLKNDYPHHYLLPRETRFGLGVYSKYPLDNTRQFAMDRNNPAIFFETEIKGKSVRFSAVHPRSPGIIWAMKSRNIELQKIRNWIVDYKNRGALVVVGDLNVSPFSPVYRDVFKTTGIKNSREGRGIVPSFHTKMPWFLQIPIDHVLHNDDLVTTRIQTGRNFGSDHLPLIVDLAFAE